MIKFFKWIETWFQSIALILLIIIICRTCNSESKVINKRIDNLANKVDSLRRESVTHKQLTIEGLRAEKRMIQSTDRKMLDVNRQSEIDKQLDTLQK